MKYMLTSELVLLLNLTEEGALMELDDMEVDGTKGADEVRLARWVLRRAFKTLRRMIVRRLEA